MHNIPPCKQLLYSVYVCGIYGWEQGGCIVILPAVSRVPPPVVGTPACYTKKMTRVLPRDD